MKTFTFSMLSILFTVSTASVANAGTFTIRSDSTQTKTTPPATPEEIKAKEAAQAEVFMARLEEIKQMDKSGMTRAEKKALRAETNSINTQMAQLGGGVYITTAGIILIIVLVILLL